MEQRVFLVDSDAAFRNALSSGLAGHGIEAVACETGMKALTEFDTFAAMRPGPACAVIDSHLPDVDTAAFLRVVREAYPTLSLLRVGTSGERGEADAFLRKPFSADQLLSAINGLTAEPRTTPTPETAETAERPGAYALVTLDEHADGSAVYRALRDREHVLSCHATKGCDLILRLDTTDQETLTHQPGVSSAAVLPVQPPALTERMAHIVHAADRALGRIADERATNVSSYVLLEVEPDKREAVYLAVSLCDRVAMREFVTGRTDLILVVHGTGFADIDATIRDHILPIDGVLRIKEYPIINFSVN
jgi:CheY-like chemotaxis protein